MIWLKKWLKLFFIHIVNYLNTKRGEVWKKNTIQYSDNEKNEKINEKGGEETHVFANFSFFILLLFEF